MTAAVLVGLPVTALVLWTILRSRLARRVVAAPTEDRWHQVATPTFGGVGSNAGFFAAAGLARALGAAGVGAEVVAILAGCALLFAAGLADDLRSLPPLAKVAAQVGAAAIAVFGGGLSADMVGNDAVAAVVALVWLVGITNAFNLLDNMDGLAATMALIASAYFALDAATRHENDVVLVLALSLAVACVGFLPFNLRPRGPALVFMGDSGSQVLGFTLGALALASSWQLAGTTAATLLLPVLVLAVPLLDTALVTVLRLVERRPVYQGGRDHTSHRLVYHGLSDKQTVVFLAVVAAGLGATGYAYTVLANQWVTLVGVLLSFALLVQFGAFLAGADGARRVQIGGFLAHRRLLAEVVVDFALTTASLAAAYLLVVEGSGTDDQQTAFMRVLPAVLVARLGAFLAFRLYRAVWRYAGAADAARIAGAVVLSEAVAAAFVVPARGVGALGFPYTVFAVDALICAAVVIASRFAERALVRGLSAMRSRDGGRRTVIVGAGRGGRSLLRELRETGDTRVVGFVDDDPTLLRRRLQGVPVLGGSDEIDAVIARAHPDTVLVTIPDAPRDRLDAVVGACARAAIECRFVRREVDLDPAVVLGATAE
jgi:UDP-GlcNAc:undecaprenyl-phosphate GlcNAc-1-phosphate transferase